MCDITLPAITEVTLPHIDHVLSNLSVLRDYVASREEISYAWQGLPRELALIPEGQRNELIAKMCIAVSVGLFDGAINYAWNAGIRYLRDRLENFGLNIIKDITQKDINQKTLLEMRDNDLLHLCLELNLISEEGYFFLNQSREVRNNYSAAHPNTGQLNDREFISFLNRIAKHALSKEINIIGIDAKSFYDAIRNDRFDSEQISIWIDRFKNTYTAQREMLLRALHGVYCNSEENETTRMNSLNICMGLKTQFTDEVISMLVNQHSEYQAQGKEEKQRASRIFFEKLNLLSVLHTSEQHSIISSACKNLYNVHHAFQNFYNEPPFAQRLMELTSNTPIPDSAKREFVLTVMLCYIGNMYGVSFAAVIYYEIMIKQFTPAEISFIFILLEEDNLISSRVKSYLNCKQRLKDALQLYDFDRIPNKYREKYKRLLEI